MKNCPISISPCLMNSIKYAKIISDLQNSLKSAPLTTLQAHNFQKLPQRSSRNENSLQTIFLTSLLKLVLTKTVLTFLFISKTKYIFDYLSNSPKSFSKYIKGALLGLIQVLITENPLKMMKNAFYFSLKALFVFKIFKFLLSLFIHVEKTARLER